MVVDIDKDCVSCRLSCIESTQYDDSGMERCAGDGTGMVLYPKGKDKGIALMKDLSALLVDVGQ